MDWKAAARKWFGPGSWPGYLFIAIAPFWRQLWRFVDVAGDIDFLASVTGGTSPVRDLFLDWGWVPVMIVGFVWLGAYVRHSRYLPKLSLQRLLFTLAIALGLFGSFELGRAFPNVGSLLAVMKPFEEWQVLPPDRLRFVLNLTEVARYGDSYKAGVICRAMDPSLDFGQSRQLTSEARTIQNRVEIHIEMPGWFLAEACNLGWYECIAALVESDGRPRAFGGMIRNRIWCPSPESPPA